MQQINACAEVYARTNAAQVLTIAKAMSGQWSYYTIPLTAANVAALISDVEETSEGLKFRLRPSNSVFYRVATANGVTPKFLASDEYVTELVADLSITHGTRCNRGHAVECLIAAQVGAQWTLNHLQSGFWQVPDLVDNQGVRHQVKAYGGSIIERDLHAAVAAMR